MTKRPPPPEEMKGQLHYTNRFPAQGISVYNNPHYPQPQMAQYPAKINPLNMPTPPPAGPIHGFQMPNSPQNYQNPRPIATSYAHSNVARYVQNQQQIRSQTEYNEPQTPASESGTQDGQSMTGSDIFRAVGAGLVSNEFKRSSSKEFIEYRLIAKTSRPDDKNMSNELLTYLNFEQAYEIEFLKSGPMTEEAGIYKTILHLSFFDEVLRNREDIEWENWVASKKMAAIEKSIESKVWQIVSDKNKLSFVWDPLESEKIKLSIKFKCLSTDFTKYKKKTRGGVKGEIFELILTTYAINGHEDVVKRAKIEENDVNLPMGKKIFSGGALIKVMAHRNANRKQRQDWQKMNRASHNLQPIYDYTVFKEKFPLDIDSFERQDSSASQDRFPASIKQRESLSAESTPKTNSSTESGPSTPSMKLSTSTSSLESLPNASSSIKETQNWLVQNAYHQYCDYFRNFNMSNLMQFSKEELIRVCKHEADGIRLFNDLHARSQISRLTLFVMPPESEAFQPIFLYNLSANSLAEKLCQIHELKSDKTTIFLHGKLKNTRIKITDEFLANWNSEQYFRIQVEDKDSEKIAIVLINYENGISVENATNED